MQMLLKVALALALIGGGLKMIVGAWSGESSDGEGKSQHQSAVVWTLVGVFLILVGLAVFRIPLE